MSHKLLKEKGEANFWLAAGSAAVAAVLLVLLWGCLSCVLGYHLGFLVVPIGSIVGSVIRHVGKSSDEKFAYLGAFVALLVCVAGNLLVECVQISMMYNVQVLDLVRQMTFNNALRILSEHSQVIDVVLYGLALYRAFKASVVPKHERELIADVKGH